MFTFLPKIDRAVLEKEYRKRVAAVFFGLLALLMLVASVLALPGFVSLLVKNIATKSLVKNQPVADSSLHSALEAQVADIRSKTDFLKGVIDTPSLISLIEKIDNRILSGITLNSITLERLPSPEITISGVASSRDVLVSFSKSLQGEPSFTNIVLPVSTLAKSKDISFSIRIDSHF